MAGIDCASAEVLVSARLDDELDAEEHALLVDHLAACPACRRRSAELETVHRRARVRPAESVPDLSATILSAADAHRRRRVRRPIALGAAAAAAVAVLGGATLTLAVAGGRAAPALAADVAVTPEPLGSSGVVYLALSNEGGGDALVGASAAGVASAVDLHRVATDDGRLVMEQAERLDCSSGLAQDAATSHLMLRDLHGPLQPGDRFVLELTFERSGPMDVVVEVVEWADLPDRLPGR